MKNIESIIVRQATLISLCVPVMNEEEAVGSFIEATVPILESMGTSYEIVFVDDGSRDGTLEQLALLRSRNANVKWISLSRNFGKECALTAGLRHCSGDVVIPIDVDLQDPPHLIPEMYAHWQRGFQVVLARRRSRGSDSWAKRTSAHAFYAVMARLTNVNIPQNVGDFRLMDRQVVKALLEYPERNRFMKGLAASVGFSTTEVLYDRVVRVAGQSKFNGWKLWNFALDGITAFSTLPLRIWTYLGGVVALFAMAFAIFIVVRTLVFGVVTPGYASQMTVMLFLGGLQMIGLGVLGEYIGRLTAEVKQRPLYFIANSSGFEQSPIAITGTSQSRKAKGS